jgi:wyosine [tRNA(Phe)-imidazoG37] synthetase (radical SAM superfamily)
MAAPSIAFGPVPSRRLGRSLGINNIPPKRCSYGCVYCQVGRTDEPTIERVECYEPERVAAEVAERLGELAACGERVDMLTFVPDGEPTLDRNLGRAIELVRCHGIPVAVITNATLLDRADVRADLGRADWICLKVDTVDEPTWRRLNRPHPALALAVVLAGAARFAREFQGILATDTMLIRGLNAEPAAVRATAAFVAGLAPSRAFLGIPTRPTAEATSAAPAPDTFEAALREFAALVPIVEPLTGHGSQGYGLTGDIGADLRSIAAVHPMREQEVLELLAKAGQAPALLTALVGAGGLTVVDYRGERFYLHRPAR